MPTTPTRAMSDSESSAAWVSWQAYTDARLTALEKQADAVERSRELRLAAECKALDARFAAMDKALAIATGEAEKRWSASNEFRSSLDDAVQTLKSVTTLSGARGWLFGHENVRSSSPPMAAKAHSFELGRRPPSQAQKAAAIQ